MRFLPLAVALIAASLSTAGAARPKVKARDDWFHVSAPAKAKKRGGYRDADWKRLRKLLASDVVPESDKRKWTIEFLVAYWRSPGVEAGMAKLLAGHVPRSKMRDALRALARGRKPLAPPSGELPGFAEGPEDAIQPAVAPAPQEDDPLEALLIAKAKEYDAKRAEVQREQLAALQGGAQDPAAVRRELAEATRLQNELCAMSGTYSDRFGPLALKGLLARENLSGPLEALQCP